MVVCWVGIISCSLFINVPAGKIIHTTADRAELLPNLTLSLRDPGSWDATINPSAHFYSQYNYYQFEGRGYAYIESEWYSSSDLYILSLKFEDGGDASYFVVMSCDNTSYLGDFQQFWASNTIRTIALPDTCFDSSFKITYV